MDRGSASSGSPSPGRGRAWWWAVVFVAVVAGIVVAVVAIRSGDGSPPATTTTTTSSSTTSEPATTTTEGATTTTTAATTTTEGAAPPAGYSVTGGTEAAGLHSRPDDAAPIVATLSADATDVVTTGLATSNLPDPGWWEVQLPDGTTGWVDSARLALPDAWTVPFTATACTPDGPAFDTTATASPAAGASDADHVFALDHLAGTECDRYVVVLGASAGSGGPTSWPSTPAASVPGDLEVAVEGSVATVTLPADVARVRPTATEAALGDATAFVVRNAAGALEVRIHFPANRRIAVSFLDEPARVVVDARSAPTGTGLDLSPIVGPRFAIARPVQVDVGGPGVTAPITVTVYGRPFEAQGSVEVRTVGSTPGSGTPVEVGFDGDFGATTSSTYSYRTTDWTEAWGMGSFTITSIPPGDYELFVGEYSAEDGSPVGVYDRFTVAP